MRAVHDNDGQQMIPGASGAGFQESPVLPRVCIGSARAMYVGPGLNLAPHLNAATTIAVSLQDPFSLRVWLPCGRWSAWQPKAACVIRSSTLHHVRSSGPMAFLFLDPLEDRRHPLAEDDLLLGRRHLMQSGNRIGIDEAFSAFGLDASRPSGARIAKVVRAVERFPHEFKRVQDAAALACLSPSRFRARFRAEVGLPFRRYRLWRRMAVVMRSIVGGSNLTDAALAAGFSSSAHLSSAFKRMFGLSASDVLALGVTIELADDAALANQSDPLQRSET